MERKSPLGRAFSPWIAAIGPMLGKKSQDFFWLCERKMGLSSIWMAFLISLSPKNLRQEVKIIPLINRCLSPIAEKTLIFLYVTACQSKPSCYLCIRIWKTGAAFSTSWEKNNSGLELDRNKKPRRFAARFETRVGRKAKAERPKKISKSFCRFKKSS